jgi:hypothetical protein
MAAVSEDQSADSSVTQCTAKALQEAGTNMAAVPEDQSADLSVTQCTAKDTRSAKATWAAVPEDQVLTPATQCTQGTLRKKQVNMGSCARGSEC